MPTRTKLILIGAEVLAIVVLRLVYVWSKNRMPRPEGSNVDKVGGRPVFRNPFQKKDNKCKPKKRIRDPGLDFLEQPSTDVDGLKP